MSKNNSTLSRRRFLKRTALGGAGLALASSFAGSATRLSAASYNRVVGANDTIRTGVIGFNGRGNALIGDTLKAAKDGEKVRVTALCDVDSKVLEQGVASAEKRGDKVASFRDLRKLYASGDVDAVIIATPNHWHSLAGIWAIQAGLDVYCEKPVSHNVWEGRQLVNAARKHSRIVQTGTQSRSSQGIKEAVEWVRAGNLGKIVISRGICYKPRPSIGKTSGPQPVPDSIDYDLWCGPAPLTPPRRNNAKNGTVHYDWHWFWDYGCGDLGNQGIHEMDVARWFLGEMALAPTVFSVGGRLGYVDDAETPNTQIVYQDYAKAPLIFEVRGLPTKKESTQMDKYKGAGVGIVIECEGGHVTVPSYNGAVAYDKDGKELKKWSGATNHMANFYDAMRSRKSSDLHADILEGHLSSALCHTGNISYRLGQRQSPEAIRDAIKSERGAEETFQRMLAHLGANEVDVMKDRITLGPVLKMDPATEKFPGNEAANALLTRNYRAPFVVTEQG
jgi:predicted dehydrogenase